MGKLTRILAAMGVWTVPLMVFAGEAGKAEGSGFTITDGDFSLETKFMVQLRSDWLSEQYDFAGELFAGAADTEIDPKFDTRLQNARVIFGGKAFLPWVSWRIETDFGRGQSRIRDAYVQLKTSHKYGFRIGQFKSPFDIYKLYSDTALSLPERPDGTNLLWPDSRDVGVMYYGSTENESVKWTLAVQNGNGANKDSNENDAFMTTARLAFENEGGFSNQATAISHPAKLEHSFGIGWMRNPQGSLQAESGGSCNLGVSPKCVFETVDRTAFELFGALRGSRWQGTVSLQRWTFEDGRFTDDGELDDADFRYWNLDFGYFVSDNDELLVRYGQWEFTDPTFDQFGDAASQESDEWRVGYTRYFSGNGFKFSVDYGSSTLTDDLTIDGADGSQDLTSEGLRLLLAFSI